MRSGMKKTPKITEMPAYIPTDADFCLKNNAGEIAIDNNFAAQSFWKEVILRYLRKISAVAGLILIVLITIMAVVGPGMSGYSYSDQNLLQKNLEQWAAGDPLTEISVDGYSVPMLLALWHSPDFLGAMEVLAEYLTGDRDKAERRIWRTRR